MHRKLITLSIAAIVLVIVALGMILDRQATTTPQLAQVPTLMALPSLTTTAEIAAINPATTPQPNPTETLNLSTPAAGQPALIEHWAAPTLTQSAQTEPLALTIPAEPVANQVVITFKPDTSTQERQAYIQQLGGTVVQEVTALNSVVVTVPEKIATRPLPASTVITASEPDYQVAALVVEANDPLYDQQWNLPVIGAADGWAQLPDDVPTITIAVIDSGVCAEHPDLSGRILPGYDFVNQDSTPQDDFGHGCGVTGIIAANTGNTAGIAGIAPNAQIMPLRVLDERGLGSYSNVAAAIVYAADHGAQIINLSLGGLNSSTVLQNAVNYAAAKGVLIIAAAGNTGGAVLYPAAYDAVIAVAAVDSNLQRSSFSSFGPQVDLLAPGRDILTTTRDGGYILMTGTSFAAPEAAGIAALQLAVGKSLVLGGGLLHFTAENPPSPPTPPDGDTETPEPTPPSMPAMRNPAAVYCLDLGYQHETVPGIGGTEDGVCILPDGQRCEQWQFYAGQCGQQYSYCAQQGLGIVTLEDGKDPFAPVYAACTDAAGQVVGTVNELSALGSRALGCYDGHCPESLPASESLSTAVDPAEDWVSSLSVPTSFDWHARPDGKNWLTGVRNQGGCGSCWAFAAVGAVEAAIKIGAADALLAPEPNLSEQYLVSSCVNFSSGKCSGGYSNSALAYIQTNGIVDEACMPYTAADANTCTRCSDWNTRLTTIKTIGTAWSNTVNKDYIQQNLVARGPVVVYLGMSNLSPYWDNGIYRCNKDHNDTGGSTSIDHAVVAVGYNDAEQYWLIRNSWGGGWNGTGYFKVGYGECNIDSTFMAWAMEPVATPTLVAPINHAVTTNPAVTFTWTTSNSPLETGYNLRIGISPNPNSSGPWLVDTTTTQTSYAYTFTAGGTYYWHLRTATDPTAATTSAWKTGSVVLKGQIPSHDQFANARVISDFPYNDVADTHLATLQTGEKVPDCGANNGKSVWYKYVANVGNAVTLDTQGSNFDTVLSVWRGTTLAGLTPVACNNDDAINSPQSALTFTPTVGDTYYFRVSGKNQTIEDQMNLNVSLGAPVNDTFAAPQLLTPPFAYIHRINTTTADFNAAELTPTCAANAGKTVWYKYPLAASSSLYFTTTGSDFTPALSLWKQTSSETPVQVACNRNNGANGVTFIDYQAEPATYYLLAADVNNVGGNLFLQMTEPLTAPLPNQPLGGVQVASDKPTFTWNPVAGAARYAVQVSISAEFAAPIETATGTSHTPMMPLLPNTYYWRVRAVGSFGNITLWSAPQTFTVISPADAAPGQNVSTSTYMKLTWGPVNWAAAYEVQVDVSPTFATYNQYWVNQDQKIPLTATVYGLQNGVYYWRVRAQKADRTWGAWSAVGTFVINSAAGRDGQTGG